MKKVLLVAVGVAGLALASGKSYNFTVLEPVLLGTTTLAPGDYKVEITGDKAVVSSKKFHEEAPAKLESSENKYNTTTVRYDNGDGKMHMQEIHVGGTRTKIVFSEGSTLSAGTAQRP